MATAVGRRPNDDRARRSVAACAALAALLALTFAVGPAGIRAVAPEGREIGTPLPPPDAPASGAMGASGLTRAQEATGIGPERMVNPSRPARPDQRATLTDIPPSRGERAIPPPILRPGDAGWVATRLEVPALGINVAVAMAGGAADEDFPPFAGAYIHRSSAQPGRGTNTYIFAHAMPNLFKPLWWAEVGQQVIVTMSDGQQLAYRVTAIVRDVPCPDPNAPKPTGLPPVLANATECDTSWILPTPTDRLSLQTSQGFNRNYGEMIVIAEPDW